MPTIYASAGAVLDSDLMKGGGTDDTAALQTMLNQASTGHPVHLIVDGVALVSGLNVYGNTTIEFVAGGGLYLKDGSRRAILRNVHRSRGAITDQHITIRGGFFNGNREHQAGLPPASPSGEADGTPICGLEFLGINYLTLEDVTLWDVRGYNIWISNGEYIHLSNIVIDNGSPHNVANLSFAERTKLIVPYFGTDGVHFNGPVRYVTIDGLKAHTGDDALAFNANDAGVDDMTIKNDMGPYVGQGPITDVVATNITLIEAYVGVRLLSINQRIDRIVVNNLIGTIQARMAVLGHYISPPPKTGHFGSVTFSNVNVDALPWGDIRIPVAEIIESKDPQNAYKEPIPREVADEWEYPLFALNSPIENLNLRNIVTRVKDGRPLVWVGPDAAVQMLHIDLSAFDPAMQTVPLKLTRGSRIERLKLSLEWQGNAHRDPILNEGGSIDHLDWMKPSQTSIKRKRSR